MANKPTISNQTNIADVTPQTMEAITNTMNSFLSAASVDAVYAKPVKAGDTVIIPAAEILSGLGFGMGGGGGTGPVTASEESDEDEAVEEAAEGDEEEAPNMAGG